MRTRVRKLGRNADRAVVLAAAVAIAAYALFSSVPGTKVGNLKQNVAQVIGVTAAVPQNPHNTLALQLAKRSQSLDEREAALTQNEAALQQLAEEVERNGRVSFFGLVVSGILLALVGINYALDRRRFVLSRVRGDLGAHQSLSINLKGKR